MPIREREMRAATVPGRAGAGATAAAFGWAASVGWAVAGSAANAECDGKGVPEAVAKALLATVAGTRLTTAAAMASTTTTQTAGRTRRPRLMPASSPETERKSIDHVRGCQLREATNGPA